MKKYLLAVTALALLQFSKAATFTSVVTGSYSAPATWSVVGVDADGIPDSNDDVTISTGNTVTLASSSNARSVNIQVGATFNIGNYAMLVWGNLTNNGSCVGPLGGWQFRAPGTLSGNILSNSGTFYFYSSYTIAAASGINKTGQIVISSGVTVTNNGSVTLSGSSLEFYGTNTATWKNMAGSSLSIASNILGLGKLDASAVSNTVTYSKNVANTIYTNNGSSYNNLVLNAQSSSTKTLSGNLIVSGNLTIGASVTLNCNNKNITLGGNWTNSANTTCTNRATITFNGAGAQTITRSSTETFNNITISGTGTVTLATAVTATGVFTISSGTFDVSASNYNLNVGGNFVHSGGTFTGRSGRVTLNGAAAQVISGGVATNFYNLTSSNTVGGVSLTATPIVVSNLLTVNNTAFSSGTGSVTIPATGPTTNGKIAPLGATASLAGNGWIIQSYINGPATGYWQFLGSPIANTTLADWDNDTRFYMSGVGGNDGNACCPIFRSVRIYNTATSSWTNILTTATALTPGKGFMLWMADNMSQLLSPLVYDSRNQANYGTILFAVSSAGSASNLVSNPYACPIDFAAVRAASGNLGVNFSILQENGTYTTNPNGGKIAANQGFMCTATSTGNMTFTEACKDVAANPNIIRIAPIADFLRIRSTNDVNGLGGESCIQFNNEAHNGYDIERDMMFMPSPYDEATNIYTTDADGKNLLCNALNYTTDNLNIPITVAANAAGQQTVSFIGLSTISGYSCAWLEDTKTGTRTELSRTDNYSFSAEAGEVRNLVLHFERTGNCMLSETAMEQSLETSAQVYVSNGNLMVQFGFNEETSVQIDVFDVQGNQVSETKNLVVTGDNIHLDSPQAAGVYFVRITKGDKSVTKKIVYTY